MIDVTALMGKLKANVQYREFGEEGPQEERMRWPVVDRMARVKEDRAGVPAASEPTPLPVSEPAAAKPAVSPAQRPVRPAAAAAPQSVTPQSVTPQSAAPRSAPRPSLLRGYGAPAPKPPEESRLLKEVFARLESKPR
jgi:hypothetical protein